MKSSYNFSFSWYYFINIITILLEQSASSLAFLYPRCSYNQAYPRTFPLLNRDNNIENVILSSTLKSQEDDIISNPKQNLNHHEKSPIASSPLSMHIEELGSRLNGKGRALSAWDCYKIGLDPIQFHSDNQNNHGDDHPTSQVWDHNINDALSRSSFSTMLTTFKSSHDESTSSSTIQEEIMNQYMPTNRRRAMGNKALTLLSDFYQNPLGIEFSIASLVNVQRSNDGTVKILLKLLNHNKNSNSHDDDDDDDNNTAPQSQGTQKSHHYIEAVIIPWYDRSNPSSTLCLSTQVGCAQGCTFCATGKMGLLKRLSTDEILIQLYYAKKMCRVLSRQNVEKMDMDLFDGDDAGEKWLPDIDNIVFMGMGESGDNADAVVQACNIMADRQCFAIPQNKITISTVAPNPGIFKKLAGADAVLAWSVHAANDELRKKLVPTTKFSMFELREGLIEAVMDRSKRLRAVMFEVTMIEDVNDGIKEAEELAIFCLEMMDRVDGMKLVVNLIPFNDIGHRSYRRSPTENVAAFQKVLVDRGVITYVRTTRGDDENAACGQLATKKVNAMKFRKE